MKRLGWVGVLIVVAGCATRPAPPPPPLLPPPPPPPPSIVLPPPVISQRSAAPAPNVMDAISTPGGTSAHLVLAVDLATVRRERLQDFAGDIRGAMLARHIVYALSDTGDEISLHVEQAHADETKSLLEQLCESDGDGPPEFRLSQPAPDGFTIKFDEVARHRRDRETVDRSAEVARRRLETLATSEPHIRIDGGNLIVVDMAGYADLNRLRGLFVPPEAIELHAVDDDVSDVDLKAGRVPSDVVVLNMVLNGTHKVQVPVYRAILLSGDHIANVETSTDRIIMMPDLVLQMDEVGLQRLAEISQTYLHRRIAVVFRGEALVAPRVMSPILDGNLQLSGNFTDGSIAQLATTLRAGSLPAPWKIVELKRN